MKTILSTILFVLSSFFISAQNLEFIVQSDNCQCVYLQVVGEGIDFIVQGITINGPNGFSMHVQEGNICDYFLDEGEYTVYVEVFVIDSQDLWIDEQSFFIFQEYIEIFPTSICDEPINSTSGGCATTYANELATYEVNAFNSIYGFDVTGGEIISQNSNQVTVLWGDTGQGSISAFGDCSDGYLCVNIEEGPQATFTATPEIVNNTIEACAGQNIFFENTSTNAVSFVWEPGTGESFSNTNLQFAYQNPGTYEVSLIAFGELGCQDTTMVTVEVDEGLAPSIDCVGTVCAGEIITYTSSNDCGVFDWTVSNNGVITNGGTSTDNFVTIEWIDGSVGLIELAVSNCTGDFCTQPALLQIPIISPTANIIGDATVCNNTTKTYSLPNYTGTEFFWTVSNRGTIESGQGTNEITVSWSSGTIPLNNQLVSVTFDNCYLGCGGSATLPIGILREFFTAGPISFG